MLQRSTPIVILLSTILTTFCQTIDLQDISKDTNLYWTYSNTAICSTIPGLTLEQRNICYQYPDSVEAVLEGFRLSIAECKYQFQYQRWNCSSLNAKVRNPYNSPFFQKGYRETAFLHAITSAGVVYSVSRACSQGRLLSCMCEEELDESSATLKLDKDFLKKMSGSSWKWGGCTFNINYGLEFAKLFLDSREQIGDMRSEVNLHNNKVGRMAVADKMQIDCKCHGISGNCEFSTCWRSPPSFRSIGKSLKKSFKSAALLSQSNLNVEELIELDNKILKKHKKKKKKNRIKGKFSKKIKEIGQTLKPEKLFYYEMSPRFCTKNTKLDIYGTTGRECSLDRNSTNSCKKLCCRRGYSILQVHIIYDCSCIFDWCCEIDCEQCETDVPIAVCN